MSEYFPTVGVIGSEALIRMSLASAWALGVDVLNIKTVNDPIELASCSVATVVTDSISMSQVKTLENAGVVFRPNSSAMGFVKDWNSNREEGGNLDTKFSVLIARSPHGQASAWTPTEIDSSPPTFISVTPALRLSPHQMGTAQSIALDLVRASGAIGVTDVEIFLKGRELVAGHIFLGPTFNGLWTIEGARTSQFEQHLRAILDLPLGDPSLTAPFVVSGTYSGEGNMYRPYLHLMARSPGLKFHQYLSEDLPATGHVTAMGRDLLDLKECVTHAVEYMSGVIDE